MNDPFFVGAYWGARPEDVGTCATRLKTCLEGLAKLGSPFSRWYEKGRSKRDALSRTIDWQQRELLVKLLKGGRNRLDSDHSIIEELGFSLGIWNGKDFPQSAGLSVRCGGDPKTANIRNCVVLNLPSDEPFLNNAAGVAASLQAIVRAWEPACAAVMSHSRRERDLRPGEPVVSEPAAKWMIYVNRVDVDGSRMPDGVRVEPIDRMGTLVIVQDRPIDALSHENVERAEHVAQALNVDRLP